MKLLPQERLIITARQISDSLFSYNQSDCDLAIVKLIQKITAISACPNPSNEYLDILEDCLKTFLPRFGFDILSFDELVLAFELNAVGFSGHCETDKVKFYGKNLSVEYISDVLNNYKRHRWQLDRQIENFIDGY